MKSALTAIVVVFLCSCAMSPKLCRDWGVYVEDSAKPTGEIVEYHLAEIETVSARCGFLTSGCAIPVFPDQWVIWSIDDIGVRTHEECHAYYQSKQHLRG